MKKKGFYLSTVKISGSLIITAVMLFFGCTGTGISEKEKKHLAEFYTEYLITLDTTSLAGSSTEIQKQIRVRLLTGYGLTESWYLSAIQSMKDTPGEWEQFYELVLKNLQSKRTSLSAPVSSAPPPDAAIKGKPAQ